MELGGDAYFFTKYYAPDYVPQLGQFAVQKNEDSRIKLGGYPFVDVYANFHLKRARFFVMMSHVNNASGNKMMFLTPHYPTNGNVLRFGVYGISITNLSFLQEYPIKHFPQSSRLDY